MSRHLIDDEDFAELCRGGALDRVEIRTGHPRAPIPLQVLGHVLDPDGGDLALRLRFGWKDEHSLEPASREELEGGSRTWVRLNGIETPLLSDDASSVLGYAEFPELRSDTSRELVNEAIQALREIWLAATARANEANLTGSTIAKALRRMNKIAEDVNPTETWAKGMKELLDLEEHLDGTVSDLRFEAAQGLPLPQHFHKVNVFASFAPADGKDQIGIALVWSDAGGGAAGLDVKLSAGPHGVDPPGEGDPDTERLIRAADAQAIALATRWMAVLETGAHEFVFSETVHVVQRLEAASRAGLAPGGDEVVWYRADGARQSAVAHLNQWVREHYAEQDG